TPEATCDRPHPFGHGGGVAASVYEPVHVASFQRHGAIMKSLGSPSFFRVFDLLLSTSNPGLKRSRWTCDGVELARERHSFAGSSDGFAVDIVTLQHAGRRGWSMMVTKEYWWAGAESKSLKSLRWARPLLGQRRDILAWMRTQEAALERVATKPGMRDLGD